MTPPHYPHHSRTFLRRTLVLGYGRADASVDSLATDLEFTFQLNPGAVVRS
jgi:hypothetical protein